MAWSPVPDLTLPGRPARTACAVSLVLAAIQIALGYDSIGKSLGDTDDAVRLDMVRGLLGGQGWYGAHIARLQSPDGLDMHWSRLVDGGLAALDLVFGLFISPAAAEFGMRLVWPLLWIFPFTLGAVLAARRIGGSSGVLAAAAFIACYPMFGQFSVGRIDHHNVQMALAMLMLAGALNLETRWGPWLAGLSTGLLLAVGLEALLFAAVVGAAVALRFAADENLADAARRYALGLAGAVLLAFFVQTPPRLWDVPACDMLSINLLAGLAFASGGLFAASFVRGPQPARLAAVALAGFCALAVYLGLDPACARGPFAHMDPRLRTYWLDHVIEVQTWPALLNKKMLLAVLYAVPAVMAAAALLVVVRDRALWRDPAWLTLVAAFVISLLSGFYMVRTLGYTAAFAAVVLAGVFPRFLPRGIAGKFVPTVLAALVVSPVALSILATLIALPLAPAFDEAADAKSAACRESASYSHIASLPPGLFLTDIDYGPDLIAHTPHSALAAPYHRINEGIVTAHDIWDSPPAVAVQRLRDRGVAYVMLCPMGGTLQTAFASDSLRVALEGGATPPAGLERVEAGSTFSVWRVR